MIDLSRAEYEDLRRAARAAARAAGARDEELVADQVLERLVVAPADVEHRQAWVRVAARRLAIDAHRAEQRRGGPTYGYDQQGADLRGPDWKPTPSAQVRRRLLVEQLLETVSQRDANLLRDWADGWTSAELAERYGLARGSVDVTLSRLRRRLREHASVEDADL